MRPITARIATLIPPVAGGTHGDRWRGYPCPLVERAALDRIMAASRGDGEAWWEGAAARCEPDAADPARPERYDPVATAVGTRWPIGAYRRAWSPPAAGTAETTSPWPPST